MSGVGLQHCDPPVTVLCYIPRFSADNALSLNCVEPIFKNKPLVEINQYCYFQCIKQHKDVRGVAHDWWLVIYYTVMARRGTGNTRLSVVPYNVSWWLLVSVSRVKCEVKLLETGNINLKYGKWPK